MEFVIYQGKKHEVKNGRLSLFNLGIRDMADIQGLENLTSLNALFIEKNQIQEIKGLEHLTNLEMLSLDRNPIPQTIIHQLGGFGGDYEIGYYATYPKNFVKYCRKKVQTEKRMRSKKTDMELKKNTIIPGKGTDIIKLGMTKEDVEREYRNPEDISNYEEDKSVYYTYYSKGIDFLFQERKLRSIFFYSGIEGGGYEEDEYVCFNGTTSEGITMESTCYEVKRAYGETKKEFVFEDELIPDKNVKYDGISFQFVIATGKIIVIIISGGV